MAKLGGLTWLDRTGGKLAWRDQLVIKAQAVRAQLAAKANSRAQTKLRHIEVEDILPPDSAITREAVAMSQSASEPYLFNHCLRAYFWARLLDDGAQPFDDEAVYTALLLHDMGLTEGYRLRCGDRHCFTVVGAGMAMQLAAKHSWPDRRARVMGEAIALHLNVTVGDADGREARMVRAGSGADVAGLGLRVLERDQIDAVVERFPRLDLKRKILEPLWIEAEQRPCCRIAFLQRELGFAERIARAPFAE